MTTVRSKFLAYESVSKRIPVVEKQIRTEVLRYYRQRQHAHPPPQGRLRVFRTSLPNQATQGMHTKKRKPPRRLRKARSSRDTPVSSLRPSTACW